MAAGNTAGHPPATPTRLIPAYMLPKKPTYRQAQLLMKSTKSSRLEASRSVESHLDVLVDESYSAEGDKEEQPTFNQVLPHKTDLDLQPHSVTLGRLFTDGGLEEILIEVLSSCPPKDFMSCLKVCKNTNTVIVKTSLLQAPLRCYMYGLGILPAPARYVRTESRKTSDSGTGKSRIANSAETVKAVSGLQRQIEHTTYTRLRPKPVILPSCKLEAMQGGTILLVQPMGWTVIGEYETRSVTFRQAFHSVFSLCDEDKVVMESHGHSWNIVDNREKIVRTRFLCPKASDAPEHDGVPHPDAKWPDLTIYISDLGRTDSEIENIKVRLYPGGMAAVLMLDSHDCKTRCTGASTRIVVYNWHRSAGLGAIRTSDSIHKIHDFQFLSDTEIVCSSTRFIDGHIHPCIDIYNIPQTDYPAGDSGVLLTRQLPFIPITASFLLPKMAGTPGKCVWTPSPRAAHITDFTLNVPNPSELTAISDQVITFQLEGRIGGDSEKISGAILVSRLRQCMLDASRKQKRTTDHGVKVENSQSRNNSPPPLDSNQAQSVQVQWKDWSWVASLHHSKSSTVLEPRSTRVANLARSRKDKTHAVMMIRDYNQRLLMAPSGHIYRNIGNPNEVCEPTDLIKVEDRVQDTFKPVAEIKSIKSDLFGQTVTYGLGHRLRMIDLGEYSYNTATSRLYWDGDWMAIVPHLPNNAFEMYSFATAYTPIGSAGTHRIYLASD